MLQLGLNRRFIQLFQRLYHSVGRARDRGHVQGGPHQLHEVVPLVGSHHGHQRTNRGSSKAVVILTQLSNFTTNKLSSSILADERKLLKFAVANFASVKTIQRT